MYLIHITGNRNAIEVSTERGEAIKKLLETNPHSDQFIDLDSRMFRLSTVREIEWIADNRSDRTPDPKEPELTPEQRAARAAMIKRIRGELTEKGIVGSAEERRIAELRAKWKAQGLVIRTECEKCLTPLSPDLRQFCSSKCMTA